MDTGSSRNEPGGESWYSDLDGGFRAPKLRPDPDSPESDTGSGTGLGSDPSVVSSLVSPRLPDAASATSMCLRRTTVGAASAMLATEKIRSIRAIVLSRRMFRKFGSVD